ncbi:GTPase [Winogradskyella sp. PE311]|uniref:GTPase n=1 Tax=Winogradskyella sp. PE311 TaxID=3366943 RepID=UPI0039818B82
MVLIFVYNANSGKLNALFDAGHKLFSPSTYPCSLCALTYDTFTENKIWKAFRKESGLEIEFYHKDEFEAKFSDANVLSYPIILGLKNDTLSPLLNSNLLNEILDIETLIERLKSTLL